MLTARQRVRIRFRKDGDLRMISHRDLARVMERIFRRAGIELGMSEGYHPKAKLSFPSALSLGIQGNDELVEVELAEQNSPDELTKKLQPHLPPGLSINTVENLKTGDRKAQVQRLAYETSIPPSRQSETQIAIKKLLAQSSCPIQRDGRDEPIDVRAGLDELKFDGSVVRFSLFATRTASVRPREVLEAIGVADLEDEGYYLTRTAVETAPPIEEKRTMSHEKGNAN